MDKRFLIWITKQNRNELLELVGLPSYVKSRTGSSNLDLFYDQNGNPSQPAD